MIKDEIEDLGFKPNGLFEKIKIFLVENDIIEDKSRTYIKENIIITLEKKAGVLSDDLNFLTLEMQVVNKDEKIKELSKKIEIENANYRNKDLENKRSLVLNKLFSDNVDENKISNIKNIIDTVILKDEFKIDYKKNKEIELDVNAIKENNYEERHITYKNKIKEIDYDNNTLILDLKKNKDNNLYFNITNGPIQTLYRGHNEITNVNLNMVLSYKDFYKDDVIYKEIGSNIEKLGFEKYSPKFLEKISYILNDKRFSALFHDYELVMFKKDNIVITLLKFSKTINIEIKDEERMIKDKEEYEKYSEKRSKEIMKKNEDKIINQFFR